MLRPGLENSMIFSKISKYQKYHNIFYLYRILSIFSSTSKFQIRYITTNVIVTSDLCLVETSSKPCAKILLRKTRWRQNTKWVAVPINCSIGLYVAYIFTNYIWRYNELMTYMLHISTSGWIILAYLHQSATSRPTEWWCKNMAKKINPLGILRVHQRHRQTTDWFMTI